MIALKIILLILVGWPIVSFVALVLGLILVLMAILTVVGVVLGYVPAILWQEFVDNK